MAKPPKPGKRFKYELEALLKVRKIKEKREQEEFAKRVQEHERELEQQRKIEAEKQQREGELRSILGKGPINNFERVLQRKYHLNIVKEQRDEQVKKTDEASQRLETQRDKLIHSVKERKVMDRHREKRLEQFKSVVRQFEGKQLDEMAVVRHVRKKSGT